MLVMKHTLHDLLKSLLGLREKDCGKWKPILDHLDLNIDLQILNIKKFNDNHNNCHFLQSFNHSYSFAKVMILH